MTGRDDRRFCRLCGRQAVRYRVLGLDDDVWLVRVGFLREPQAAGLSLYVESVARGLADPVAWISMRPREGGDRGPFMATHASVCARGRP